MSFITTHEGEDTMYKRTLKTLLAASVVALAIPVQAAVGMPMSDSSGAAVVHRSSPVVSEKVAGLNIPVQVQRTAPIVSEKAQGFTLSTRETGAALTKSPIVSEKVAGLNLPTQQQPVERVVVSSDPTFDWGDAGIGAAVTFGSLLAAVAAAGMVRRHHWHVAH
jgi:hypothetical protein